MATLSIYTYNDIWYARYVGMYMSAFIIFYMNTKPIGVCITHLLLSLPTTRRQLLHRYPLLPLLASLKLDPRHCSRHC